MIDSTTGLFQQFAAAVGPSIERCLDTYSQFGPDCPQRLQAAIRHSLMAPGKRLRPLLVLSASEACGSSPEGALPAACAVEMVHTYSLIHDDLPAMDDDDLRRGRPSCHAAFDEATAILAGDALLTRAFEIMATDLPPAVAARCCAELAHAAGATQMVGGQAADLAAENCAGDLAQLEAIHRRKTEAASPAIQCCHG
jgi:geranylgeranyl diphosphate synthase type II